MKIITICAARIIFLYECSEPKTSMAILRGWPKMFVRVRAYAQATSCVTFWSVRGATVRHTHRLRGKQQPTLPTLHHQISISLQFCCITHHLSPHYLAISACHFNPDMSYCCPFSLFNSCALFSTSSVCR